MAPLLEAIGDERDTVTAMAAVHALAEVPGRLVEDEMAQLMGKAVNGFDAHAAWAASRRPASRTLIEPLTETVGRGGLAGMHAQQALARWAIHDADIASAVLVALDVALRETGVASRTALPHRGRWTRARAGRPSSPGAPGHRQPRRCRPCVSRPSPRSLTGSTSGCHPASRPWPRRAAASARPCARRERCRCFDAVVHAAPIPGKMA